MVSDSSTAFESVAVSSSVGDNVSKNLAGQFDDAANPDPEGATVDGKNLASLRTPEIMFKFVLSRYNNVFGHPKWCQIFSYIIIDILNIYINLLYIYNYIFCFVCRCNEAYFTYLDRIG